MPEYMSEPWRGDYSKYRSNFCFSSVQVASMILLCSGGLGKCKKNIPIYNQWLHTLSTRRRASIKTAQRSQCRKRCGKKMQGLTKVNIPLLKHDPTCMLLSKLKPGWLLIFGLYQYCLVYSGVGIHSFEKVRTKNCRCLDAKLLSKQAILLSKLPNATRTRIIVWKEQRSASLLDVTA